VCGLQVLWCDVFVDCTAGRSASLPAVSGSIRVVCCRHCGSLFPLSRLWSALLLPLPPLRCSALLCPALTSLSTAFARFALTLSSVAICALETFFWWYKVDLELIEPLHGFVVHTLGFPCLEFFGSFALHTLRAVLPVSVCCLPLALVVYCRGHRFAEPLRQSVYAFTFLGMQRRSCRAELGRSHNRF
jgi:hypothetical protein